MLKNYEINGTEEIGLVTPTPGIFTPKHKNCLNFPYSPFVRDHLAFKTSLRGGPFSEVSLDTLQGAVNIFEIHHKNLFLCYFSALKKGKYTQTWISMRMKLMEKETSAWKKSFAVGNMWGTASDTWKGMVRFEVLYQS